MSVVQKDPLAVAKAEHAITLDEFYENVMRPRLEQCGREQAELFFKTEREMIAWGCEPPPPLPWWRRWPQRVSAAMGTLLIRLGLALGGDPLPY
jgi:hypothetical protein